MKLFLQKTFLISFNKKTKSQKFLAPTRRIQKLFLLNFFLWDKKVFYKVFFENFHLQKKNIEVVATTLLFPTKIVNHFQKILHLLCKTKMSFEKLWSGFRQVGILITNFQNFQVLSQKLKILKIDFQVGNPLLVFFTTFW